MTELYADIVLPLAQDAFTFAVDWDLRDTIAEGQCVKVPLGDRKFYMGVVWKLHGDRPPFKTIKTVDSPIAGAPVIGERQRRFWQWMADYYMCPLGEVMRAALPSALKPEGFSHAEFSKELYRPPTVQHISLIPTNEEALNEKFESLRRAKKQYAALIDIVAQFGDNLTGKIPRVSSGADGVILKALAKKSAITLTSEYLKPGELPPLPMALPKLSDAQADAACSIRGQFRDGEVVLLHGVTGSGKTEIYIDLIAEQLGLGRNVMYLLPEIAMSGQLIERIRTWFGDRVIPYHSKFSMRSRVESYRRMACSRGGEILLGVRSSLFLPVENLGLVIIDEEHDQSYKQTESAPRYHARDAAIVLARGAGAKTLLGSATPSIESYANATEGKYGLVTLTERYGGVPHPQVYISDTLRAVKRGERTSHFNKLLLDKAADTLARGKQVMLFQNRRGFSPYVECTDCGRVEICPHCNVTLTFHKSEGQLRCHYCGFGKTPPRTCAGCGAEAVETRGFGTEKVEEELAKLLPDARIERLDRDTAQTAKRYNSIITSFECGDTDVLIGTQMITKGFDFDGVSLVGVLNADNLLAYPDFRAAERAFQLIMQVAGRAGRRSEPGEVVIQTSQPENPVIREAAAGDYGGMVRSQLAERAEFFYPPYCRLIAVTLKHRDKTLLWNAANVFAREGRAVFGRRILGPQPPSVDKIRGEHLLSFLLKVERRQSFAAAKKLLAGVIEKLHADRQYKYITVVCNVDPQ